MSASLRDTSEPAQSFVAATGPEAPQSLAQSGEEAYQRRLAMSQAVSGEDAYQRRLAMSQGHGPSTASAASPPVPPVTQEPSLSPAPQVSPAPTGQSEDSAIAAGTAPPAMDFAARQSAAAAIAARLSKAAPGMASLGAAGSSLEMSPPAGSASPDGPTDAERK